MRNLLLFISFGLCVAWESFELEIFDVVEEDASSADIKKAYRKLSLQLHPDKNDKPDAEAQFRNLVAIYEILKDEKKRLRYDRVLVEGLPNWRNPLYYYRRYRKMGGIETSIWLIVLTSIIQFAVSWTAYWEKKFEIREVLGSKAKKQKKQSKKKGTIQDEEIDLVEEEIKQIPKPRVWDLVPFLCIRLCIWTAKFIVSTPQLYKAYQEEKQKKEEKAKIEEEERLEEERRVKEIDAERKHRKKKTHKFEERNGDIYSAGLPPSVEESGSVIVRPEPVISGGFWTDEDIAELVKLMKKYPPGVPARWEKIAEVMNRTVAEITKIAYREKNNIHRSEARFENAAEDKCNQPNEEKEDETALVKKKVKTKGGKFAQEALSSDAAADCNWSQKQQKALETALGQYPKGSLERWDKVAKAVPGKTKEECMLRIRYLAELIRKKKEEEEEERKVNESLQEDENMKESQSDES
ncbi:hypothetical protein QYM36_007415 [Artemia franciscana]|uniref:DnaJ homolog subfamily C member 1 n=1 Tax=Artemia franciscana TaxID=6661 RepID=A0AA88L9G4_ARTSF|nr:hypothetical protein QYM36_007415 [Artemia franciscana]